MKTFAIFLPPPQSVGVFVTKLILRIKSPFFFGGVEDLSFGKRIVKKNSVGEIVKKNSKYEKKILKTGTTGDGV